MFNPLAYANAAPAGVAVLETVIADGAPLPFIPFVPLRRTTINGRWEGPLAELTITHTYAYTREQCDRVLEAIYRFPLPGDAAVHRVVVTFGDTEIVAELKERKAAEEAYEEAKRQGQQAVLTTRESPDVFTLQVAGLQPDQEVVVETTCVLLAAAEGPGWSLRIPLTTAPRYTRADERGSRHARGQPLAVYRDPGHRFALDLITAGGSISSPTHALTARDEDGHTRVQLQAGELVPDRDCVLVWRPDAAAAPAERPLLQVLAGPGVEIASGATYTYFVALVSPPAADALPAIPREALVLVDHSGSMSGAKWSAADDAALRFLADLGPGDRGNLGVFDNTTRWLSPDPVAAGSDMLAQARRFLVAERDGGGTELGVALEQALRQRTTPGEVSRQIVIITDAQVTDDARILQMVEDAARQPDRRRISVLCIDAAPNAYLTQQLAALGGGIARFLTSEPDAEDVSVALAAILAGWSQPVAAGLRLEVNRPAVEAAKGRAAVAQAGADGWSALDLGDLTLGRSLWVSGRIPASSAEELTFRVAGAGIEPVQVTVGTESGTYGAMSGALKAVFGAFRVLGLERLAETGYARRDLVSELERLGYDPALLAGHGAQEPGPVYAENARHEGHERVRDLLLREALDYGLLCSVTGFVAVRKEQGLPVEGTSVIGNALPQGWEGGMFLNAMSAPLTSVASLLRDGGGPRVMARPHYARQSLGRDMADLAQSALKRAKQSPLPLGTTVRYAGSPLTGGQGLAVLFDTGRLADAEVLAGNAEFRWLALQGLARSLTAQDVPRRLAVAIEIDGSEVARLAVADIVRRGGQARVRVQYRSGQRLRVLLVDPDHGWETAAPEIDVELR